MQRIHEAQATFDAVAPEPTPGSRTAEASDTSAVVRTALQSLRPEERRPIELAFFDGLTYPEIAEALRTPEGTTKARIRRGMIKLRRTLTSLETSGQLKASAT